MLNEVNMGLGCEQAFFNETKIFHTSQETIQFLANKPAEHWCQECVW